jgi:hypothetical protein
MKAPQINLNSVKDVLKKLSFLKNNLALLVPVIIAFLAVLLFIPTRLLSARLKNTITQQSVRTASEIERLIRDVNEASQAQVMAAYIEAYAQDPCDMETLIRQTTMRSLLSYQIFPEPNETSPLLFDWFRRAYLAGTEDVVRRLGAVTPPTEGEIKAALETSSTRSMPGGQMRYGGGTGGDPYSGMYSGGAGMGRGMGMGMGYGMMTEMDRKIIDKLCEDKARGGRLYASPVDLDGYVFWSDWRFESRETAIRECWYWQMGYWMLEDVVATIEQINRKGTNILNSPVKRIMDVGLTQARPSGRSGGFRRGRGIRREGDRHTPTYVINARTALAAPPVTGRFCNEDVDVMHFNLCVVVEADQVIPFIQQLCSAKTHTFRGWYGDLPEQTFKHNQITVLESVVRPIERERPEHGLYRYGEGAVVELDLICEYIFHKEGYDEVMPEIVKDDIAGLESGR